MILQHYDISSIPAQGNTSLCILGTHTGRQMTGSAFWRSPQGQPELGLDFGRRSIAGFLPAPPLCNGKLAEKSFGRPFSNDGKSTCVSLDLFPLLPTSYVIPWRDCANGIYRRLSIYLSGTSRVTVTNSCIMINSKINRLLQGLRVAEVAGLAHTLCSLHQSCEAALSADVYLRNVMADLQDLSDRILDALRNNRLISSLETYDAHRMRCVSALVNLKKGYDKLSDESTQSHWTELRPVFENYLSAIQAGNYQSKTALINALLLRLSDNDLASHLEGLVTMQTAVDRLREAETAFENMQVEYQHQLLEDKTESATDLKEAIIELINQKLVVHLEAKCNEDAATYDAFAKLVDAQIRTDNAKLRRRKGKKETSSEIPTTE